MQQNSGLMTTPQESSAKHSRSLYKATMGKRKQEIIENIKQRHEFSTKRQKSKYSAEIGVKLPNLTRRFV